RREGLPAVGPAAFPLLSPPVLRDALLVLRLHESDHPRPGLRRPLSRLPGEGNGAHIRPASSGERGRATAFRRWNADFSDTGAASTARPDVKGVLSLSPGVRERS